VLGGNVRVESTPGVGSRFFLTLPVHYTALPEPVIERPPLPPSEPWRVPVLIVEDERDMQLYYERVLRDTPYRPIGASTLHQASAALEHERPGIIILDILLGSDDAWRWLAELKGDPATKAIPVIVVTAVDEERKALALGADRFVRKPIAKSHLMDLLNQVTASRVLIVDDDATTRYAMRKLLDASDFVVLEASNGEEGLRAAEAAKPHSIVLDLELPDLSGFDVLDRFKAFPATHDIPVIVATAGDLTDAQRSELDARAFAVLSKRDILGNIVATVTAASNKPL
jgi:CheY-like chemotaxis protein